MQSTNQRLVGATLLYGDGTIRPAIPVLSAIEGLKLYAPHPDPGGAVALGEKQDCEDDDGSAARRRAPSAATPGTPRM